MATNIPVVALIGMALYILGFESGPGPLFYVMATQDFPKELVSQGLGLSNVLLYVLNIILTFFFPILTTSIGAGSTFTILGGFQLLSLVYFSLFRSERYGCNSSFIRRKEIYVTRKQQLFSVTKSPTV